MLNADDFFWPFYAPHDRQESALAAIRDEQQSDEGSRS
jgi:hypothetical protein